MENEIEITITISRVAYERAAHMAQDERGIAGEYAGMMTTEEFIERYLEIMLEPNTPKKP